MSGLRESCTAALGPFDAESSKVVYPEEFWHNRAAIDTVRQPEEKTASLGFEPRLTFREGRAFASSLDRNARPESSNPAL